VCEQLARRGQFVVAQGVEEWPNGVVSGRYRFTHGLYLSVLYERLAPVSRVQFHRRIAEQKAAAYGARVGEIAGELAAHYEKGRDRQHAMHYHSLAGASANQRHAHQEALTHLTKGLALLQALPASSERDQQERTLQAALNALLIAIKGSIAAEEASISAQEGELCGYADNTTREFALEIQNSEPVPDPQPLAPNIFRHEGDYWTLAFAGEMCRVRHTLGMHYLVQLLHHPRHEFPVLALAADGMDPTLSANSSVWTLVNANRYNGPEHSTHVGLSDAGELLDAQAKATYKRRLHELHEELDEAQAFNDTERANRIQEEIDFLTAEITRAVGLGGRMRKAASAVERARVNVTLAIKTALKRITSHHPALGHYLTRTIKTGYACVYTPDPALGTNWEFSTETQNLTQI
jgi:hypothetical protein